MRALRPVSGLRKAAQHRGRTKDKFSFAILVHGVDGLASSTTVLPEDATLVLQISRGQRVVATDAKVAEHGAVCWEQSLEFTCTLYASKKGTRQFSEKCFRVSLLLLSGRKRPVEIAAAELDVGAVASVEPPVERRLNHAVALVAVKARGVRARQRRAAEPHRRTAAHGTMRTSFACARSGTRRARRRECRADDVDHGDAPHGRRRRRR